MFSRPMNTRSTPARPAFSMKRGILWHSVSTWIVSVKRQAFLLAQRDQAVEDRFPVLVAGEVVVGDEELVHALREVGADDALDVVGAAMRATCGPAR